MISSWQLQMRSTEVFPGVPLSGCYFHLGKIIYKRVQSNAIREQYRDTLDRTVKQCTHMLLALAFVSEADVLISFAELCRKFSGELHGAYNEFKEFFITRKPARGRRPATRTRCPISLWNHYETDINKSHRTNNVLEGWHNRFRLVIGKHHPDICIAIGEIQKEQGYVEICINKLTMGVKATPT